MSETTNLTQQQLVMNKRSRITAAGRQLPFFFLVGFIATQGHLIPIFALPMNWAIWPSLPDIFGIGLVLSIFFSRSRLQLTPYDREMLKDLLWMFLIFFLNFLFVTIPFSKTGDGIRYAAFSLILLAKYIAVYWAASHVLIDARRLKILNIAALIAFFWLTLLLFADRLYFFEINTFASHLPKSSAGKWAVADLSSTVSSTHGMTTVVILILSAIIVTTSRHRFTWLVEGVVFILGAAGCFLVGSRQGIIRFATFILVYSVRKSPGYFFRMFVFALLIFLLFSWITPSETFAYNSYYIRAVGRQNVLLDDPFSNEGLAGRPELWLSALDTLNDAPYRWIIGYGMGNYFEYKNAAHNMLFQFLQDGGIIELVCAAILWTRIFMRIWFGRKRRWGVVALTAGMLTSFFTSAIFYPNLATGWYLGLYFVFMHLVIRGANEGYPKNINEEG